jgi:hypothetical protein
MTFARLRSIPGCEERAPSGEPGDRLPGEVVVGEQAARVGVALERLAEQHVEDLVVVGGCRMPPRSVEQARPRRELARAVVAVDHRDRVAGGRRDEVEFVVDGASGPRARPSRRCWCRR